MKKTLLKASAVGLSLLPMVAFAQSTNYNITNLGGLINAVQQFINAVTPVLISVSVFAIIIGIVMYFINLGNEDKKKEAMSFIMYGVIFLFLMISIYGLVNIIRNTITLDSNKPTVPSL